MKRKILFRSILLILLFFPWSYGTFADEKKFPGDVLKFIEKRDTCDHFRGEPIYSKERYKYLIEMMNKTCKGTDKELERLKKKYRKDPSIMKKLNLYEENIQVN